MGKAKSSQVLAYGERRKLKNESKYLERERDPKRRDHNLFFFSFCKNVKMLGLMLNVLSFLAI